MPIYLKTEQRSAQWYQYRLGVCTASEFHKVLTAGGKVSAQAEAYAHRLLAEMMLGRPIEDDLQTQYMQRGQELEDAAISCYEFQSESETDAGGFVTTDDKRIGCSPDRLIGEDGVLEMKCPCGNVHVSYLLDPNSLAKSKGPQVQGELYVTGRRYVDLVSYHPELPPLIVRVTRDEDYIAKLHKVLGTFMDSVYDMRMALEAKFGAFKPIAIPSEEKPAPVDYGEMGLGDEDVTAIWKASQAR